MITTRAVSLSLSPWRSALANRAAVPAAGKHDPLADALAWAEAESEKDYQPIPFYKTKVKDLMVSMMDRLLTKCMDATGEAEMTDCLHERMLVGFDRDGTLRSQCKSQGDAGEDLKCIVFGGMGHELRSKLAEKSAAPFDWAAPEESTHLVMRRVVLEQLRNCLNSGRASDPFDCFIGRITKVLDLSASDLDPCIEFEDDDTRFGQCVGESYAYKYMSVGVERM